MNGFIWGLLAGAAAGVLLAPRAGKETREQLNQNLEQWKTQLQPMAEKAQPFMQQAMEKAQPMMDKAQEVKEAAMSKMPMGDQPQTGMATPATPAKPAPVQTAAYGASSTSTPGSIAD